MAWQGKTNGCGLELHAEMSERNGMLCSPSAANSMSDEKKTASKKRMIARRIGAAASVGPWMVLYQVVAKEKCVH